MVSVTTCREFVRFFVLMIGCGLLGAIFSPAWALVGLTIGGGINCIVWYWDPRRS